MKVELPLTVISDLHVGHPASYIKHPDELAPLFRDVASVVFNGDSVEMLWLMNRDRAAEQVEQISSVCLAQGARPVFLAGNHDPVVSSAGYLDLVGGSILVTHGDILFHDIAPWSSEARILGPEHLRILEGMSDDERQDLAERLVAVKKTALKFEMHEPKRPGGGLAKLRTLIREGWPPWRALGIIRCWMLTPGAAEELAKRFRPKAKFVLIGHTHYAGVWHRNGRVIINTGSFMPISGRTAVRIEANRMEVRKIVKVGNQWNFGKTIANFELTPAKEPVS